jgi:hypothetical protein
MAVGLSESATIGVLLLLIFGAISFYLYSRINYTEKRMSLMENMLLDIKVGLQMTTKEEAEFIPEPVGAPTPMETEEAEVLPEEETYYQSVLQQAQAQTAPEADVASEPVVQQQASVTVNYESMTKDELIALAEKRGVKMGKRPGRKDLIAALRKPEDVPGASPTSEIFPLAAQLEQVGDEAETLE